MVKKYRKRFRAKPELIGGSLYQLLERLGGHPAKSRLSSLWANWEEIMGQTICELMCEPSGKGTLLVVGVENSLQMQTLHLMAGEILERANQYLETLYFTDIRINLTGKEGGQKKEDAEKMGQVLPVQKIPSCAAKGAYLPDMDITSPVARCYARFVKKCQG